MNISFNKIPEKIVVIYENPEMESKSKDIEKYIDSSK